MYYAALIEIFDQVHCSASLNRARSTSVGSLGPPDEERLRVAIGQLPEDDHAHPDSGLGRVGPRHGRCVCAHRSRCPVASLAERPVPNPVRAAQDPAGGQGPAKAKCHEASITMRERCRSCTCLPLSTISFDWLQSVREASDHASSAPIASQYDKHFAEQ